MPLSLPEMSKADGGLLSYNIGDTIIYSISFLKTETENKIRPIGNTTTLHPLPTKA